ncbi:hypothetical protein BDY17DRAFT_294748 [Neohortaea acidophila]|uniref:Uncharacterized protein n=1 Tax=Neohortaea acidophila TaxID=245834 RepID=A0A6A6PVG4_9PEZI|nr:uncharacterized protein BDY17DRAFT_294748 [Neohortaea acidophila]KAF2483992.1 hypothetical protein BDY17DRAFT_294748 [Neohortaea acidophila]
MLLDAEEDLHQPIWDPQGLMSFDQRRDTPEPSSLAVIRGSQMMDDYGGMPANVRSIEMRQRLPSHVETLLERPTPGYERGESPAKDFEDSRTSNKYQADVQLSEPPDQLRITLVRTAANAEDDKLLFTAASEAQSEDSQSDDEELWREILKIKHPPSSHHSLRALHSASAHIATSDSHIDHPELQHFIRALNGGDNSVGGVVRPDDQPSMTDRQHDEGLKEGIPKAPSPMQSPSTSFHQIETLARHKTIEERRINDDADDEALWRQFIVGTQSSSISSEHGIDDARTNASTTGHGTITAAPSLFNISGLGTSDEANPGNSQWVDSSVQSAGPSRTSSHGSDARSIDAEYDAQSKDRDAATHDGRDVESIEDVQSPTFHNEASFNIHSTPLRVLNPHRFKKPSKPRCEPGQKANLFRLPRR